MEQLLHNEAKEEKSYRFNKIFKAKRKFCFLFVFNLNCLKSAYKCIFDTFKMLNIS